MLWSIGIRAIPIYELAVQKALISLPSPDSVRIMVGSLGRV